MPLPVPCGCAERRTFDGTLTLWAIAGNFVAAPDTPGRIIKGTQDDD